MGSGVAGAVLIGDRDRLVDVGAGLTEKMLAGRSTRLLCSTKVGSDSKGSKSLIG